jgi:hypothetical protein
MRGTVFYGLGDVRFEERAAPMILEPTDSIIRISATCVCGSDLWSYRGISPVAQPRRLPAEKHRLECTAFPQEYDRRRRIPRAATCRWAIVSPSLNVTSVYDVR